MSRYRYCIALLVIALLGCDTSTVKQEKSGTIEPLEIEGVKNAYRLSPRILTGGKPEGEAGFAELQKLGIKTIVSVEEAPPDEEAAKKHGIRYVHVPMTYEGVTPEQTAKILGAARDTSGPVYLHCSTGRNRAATASALCLVGIEGKSNEEAIEWMKQRGTKEEHKGLYEAVQNYKPEPKE